MDARRVVMVPMMAVVPVVAVSGTRSRGNAKNGNSCNHTQQGSLHDNFPVCFKSLG